MTLKKISMSLLLASFVFLLSVNGLVRVWAEGVEKGPKAARQKVGDLAEPPIGRMGPEAREGQGSSREDAYKSEEIQPHLPEIKEELKEEPAFEINGGLVGFYQGGTAGRIEGENVQDPSQPGIVADLQLTYRPPISFFTNGRFFVRLHAGKGKGADDKLEGRLFANLNTLADDSDDLQKDSDKVFWLPEVYYAQELLDGKFTFTVGKSEPAVFIDDNAFANNPNSQFVGKPFVNNPVFDSEDEYAPIVVGSFSPIEVLSLTVLAVSSSHPNSADEGARKSVYSRIFDQPLVAAQLACSPRLGELQGNYRVYFWDAMYERTNSAGDTRSDGRGIGLSLDQLITDRLGLFARIAYSDQNAYDVDWFWSIGAKLKGVIPSRSKDELGLGLAGLKGAVGPDNNGTELHFEAYYRIALMEYLAVSPDIQYVADPLGNSHNGGVFAGMVRVELAF